MSGKISLHIPAINVFETQVLIFSSGDSAYGHYGLPLTGLSSMYLFNGK